MLQEREIVELYNFGGKMPVDIPKEKWSGTVRTVVIGATAENGGTRSKVVQVGGMNTMPFLHFEADYSMKPVIAVEILDKYPADWSTLLKDAWGDVMKDPASWAKAAEEAGADLIQLQLSAEDEDGNKNTPARAVEAVKKVLGATGLPLIVYGPGQADLDNELLVPVSDAAKGERIALGICEDKNYRTIVASALANDHLVTARAPMDVNLSKQLNILVNDMGLSLDRVLMDPTVGALGYGLEYGYSAMERLRLAALQGDAMTQLPMIVGVGYETWKAKESKVGHDVPEAWGDWLERGINWETLTAVTLIESGAEVIILRHPESLKRVRAVIEEFAKKPA
jgi:acetyl-CoA decarbonylase/synthase complex subunit delta